MTSPVDKPQLQNKKKIVELDINIIFSFIHLHYATASNNVWSVVIHIFPWSENFQTSLILILFPLPQIHYHNLRHWRTKKQNGLKIIKPRKI